MRYLEGLTEEQALAVHSNSVNLFISAGPGSGKTRVLITRVFEKVVLPIINETIVNGKVSDRTVIITFTNKAAMELKQRLNEFIKQHTNNTLVRPLSQYKFKSRIFVGTFHAFGFELIRKLSHLLPFKGSGFSIIDNNNAKKTLSQIATRVKAKKTQSKEVYKEFKDKHFFEVFYEHKQSTRLSGPKLIDNKYIFDVNHFAKVFLDKNYNIGYSADRSKVLELYCEIYEEYCSELYFTNSLDFHDLLQWPIYIYMKAMANPELSKDLNRIDKLVINNLYVDEYQDSNTLQLHFLQIIKEYSDKVKSKMNSTVVGDPDQSIFGWRDHKPLYLNGEDKNIKNRRSLFESSISDQREERGWETIFLSKNFRSTPAIINTANKVIFNDGSRKSRNKDVGLTKDFDHKGSDKDPKPVLICFPSEKEEAKRIVNSIKSIKDNANRFKVGVNYRDISILVRATRIISPLVKEFLYHGIPYEGIGNFGLWNRKAVVDILAHLNIINNPCDKISLARIFKFPPKKITLKIQKALLELINSEFTFKDFVNSLNQDEEDINMKNFIECEGVQKLRKQFNQIYELVDNNEKQPTLDLFIKELIEIIEYDTNDKDATKLEDGAPDPSFDGDDPLEGATPLEALIKFSETLSYSYEPEEDEDPDQRIENMGLKDTLTALLQAAGLGYNNDDALTDNEKKKAFLSRDTVKIATLHSSKGLEWPIVYIVGVDSNLIPHYFSTISGRTDEEARLLYVGITRCKYLLAMSYCRRRDYSRDDSYGEPSPFLSKLDSNDFNEKFPSFDKKFFMNLATFLNLEYDTKFMDSQSVKVIRSKGNDGELSPMELDHTSFLPGFASASSLLDSNKRPFKKGKTAFYKTSFDQGSSSGVKLESEDGSAPSSNNVEVVDLTYLPFKK